MPPNPYLLAADNPQALVALLEEDPSLAKSQDEHGYSLVHAAASYNHLDLLRSLIRDFHVPVDLKDEDGETALFVVETEDAARLLVEELGSDASIENDEGLTAQQRIEAEGDWPAVAEYLLERVRAGRRAGSASAVTNGVSHGQEAAAPPIELPPVPEGLQVTVGTIDGPAEVEQEPDPEFRRRIEQLAAREDFQTPEGQEELRRLVMDAISGQDFREDRNVRPRDE